ncbi:MAG TPA: hypothetical protein VHL34_08255, partial [Rhizomicrobium sp.]|nr:hypothetical protein [Rhizomicrobium sp.]
MLLRPQHALVGPERNWLSPKRAVSLGLVGVIHLALLYALMTGMAQKIVKILPPVLQATIIEESVQPKTEIVPPKPQMEQPTDPTAVAPPDIVIDT